MEKINGINVLYGGSFNPPTIAHYEIAKKVIEYYQVSDFVFLPTGNIYHKDYLLDAKYRIDMLQIVCKHLTNARVSDFEVKQSDLYRGTVYTLKVFKGYWFLLGTDNLKDLPKWIDFPNLVKNNHFIVINRNNLDVDMILSQNEILNKYKNNFTVFNQFDQMNVSSSKYRETLDPKYVLEDIHEYVIKNKLYK